MRDGCGELALGHTERGIAGIAIAAAEPAIRACFADRFEHFSDHQGFKLLRGIMNL